VETHRAELWTLNKVTDKQFAAFERKVFRTAFVGIKLN
jgi:hypothetical protein